LDLVTTKPRLYFGVEEFFRVRKSQFDIGYQFLLVRFENDAVAGILVVRMFRTIKVLEVPINTTCYQQGIVSETG
jgi:hypothetical protein